MKDIKYCESCGMFLNNAEEMGTNMDGSKNEEYCIYCYKDGKFTTSSTMEEMIEVSVQHMKDNGILRKENKTEEEARELMNSFFPNLKRWKCTCTDDCASGHNAKCACTNPECHCAE